ncbi:radical SAM family heme chaperone HemW, partial [Bacteroidota bacterium]
MAGIYIHIPFCKKKCHYCNFFSVASEKLKIGFIESLIREVEIRNDYLESEEVNTIYFGGGTPSLLDPEEINRIIQTVNRSFNVVDNVEISLEFNPDDVTQIKLNELKDTGVNRISLGVQSFNDKDLLYLDRTHNSADSKKAIESIILSEFSNITIDLIYGIPGSDLSSWENNLLTFIDYDIPHLSAYALTVENSTSLKWLIEKKKLDDVSEKLMSEQFKLLLNILESNNYIHYEISNFARKGYYSKHNSLYWLGGNYIGLGPSAHSYNGKSRQWNISNISKYKESFEIQNIVKELEVLTNDQKYNEYVMTSLRTVWGIDIEHISNVFGIEYSKYFEKSTEKFIQQKLMNREVNKFSLTNSGKFLA